MRDISIVLKGNYTDREVKKAIRDLQSLQTQAPKTGKSFQMMSTQFKGFALGIGAGAVLRGLTSALVGMAGAAAADEKSVVSLGKTLSNLGMQSAQQQVEDFVKAQMLATGVADDMLRPAMSRLLRSTGDVTESQRALQIALDISAATGKDLDTVANGLGKAYDGNAASLGRLGLGLDKALLKSGDMARITSEIERKFGGQAAAAAETYAGKIARISTAAGEAAETVGYSLLNAADDVTEAFGGTDGVVSAITAAGESLADFTAGIGSAASELSRFRAGGSDASTSLLDIATALYKVVPQTGLLISGYQGLADAGSESRRAEQSLNDELDKAALLRKAYSGELNQLNVEESRRADALAASKRSAEELKTALDKLYGTNRSILSQKIDLRAGFAEGPQGHTVGKGKNAHEVVSRDEALKWAISQSSTASDIAQAYAGRGQFKKALSAWDGARGQVMATLAPYGVGSGKINSFMGPAPKEWRDKYAANQSARNADEWRQNAAPIYLRMTVNAPTPADAVQWAKDAARLAQLNRGMATADAAHDYDAARKRVTRG